MRIIKLNNKDIKSLLKEKLLVVEKGRKLSGEIEEKYNKLLKEELEKIGFSSETDKYQVNVSEMNTIIGKMSDINRYIYEIKIKDEVDELNQLEVVRADLDFRVIEKIKEIKIELEEFEEMTSIEIVDEELEVKVVDKLEEFKEKYRNASNS